MGDKYGPMVVARSPMNLSDLRGKTIAIPGKLTTAFLALQLCLGKAGDAFRYEVVEFDQIPAFVRDGKADAGLIIHEGQLTYRALGLHLAVDLGAWWHEKTDLPLPLGGNCIRMDLGRDAMQAVTDVLKRSIQFSLDHRKPAVEYALRFGRNLNRQLADQFVGMYVNQWTVDYGPRGREAVRTLLKKASEAGLIPNAIDVQFVG